MAVFDLYLQVLLAVDTIVVDPIVVVAVDSMAVVAVGSMAVVASEDSRVVVAAYSMAVSVWTHKHSFYKLTALLYPSAHPCQFYLALLPELLPGWSVALIVVWKTYVGTQKRWYT